MSIFNNGNFAKPFNVSQPQLNSSDRTANLRSKTKYAAAVNLAKNGGVLTKQDGSKYVGPVHTTTATMTSADSYSDLLDVTKGKYLLTPPPSSNLDTSFSPASGDVFYGSFTVTDYAEAKIPVTMLGAPGVTSANKYVNPNQLVAASTTPPPPFNNTSIVVDPEYRLFYGKKTCGMRDYFKNVRIDPNADVRWTDADGVVHSSRPYNQQQAQRILAHEAQRLRGFQYPARVHLDLDNCESKPSITPVAPDAPVIYISSQTLTSDEPELFTVTVAWPHGFDGGSPITSYTVYTSTGESYTVDPQPCLNSYTLYNIALTTQISVTASNCIPQSTWASGTPAPHCTPMTSPKSNPVNPNPPRLPTITVAFSSGSNSMTPYEPGKVITLTITSDNPMPFSVTSSELDNGLAQLNQPNGGGGTRALTATNGYSITLLPGKNPAARTPISVSFMQASGGGYSRGFATATLVILPALPPKITIGLAASTVQYAPNTTIPMTISTSNYPVAQSDYAVSTNNSGLTRINTLTNAGGQIVGYTVSLLPNANPNTPTTPITITVIQPATLDYPSGTATKTLTITPASPPQITIGLPATVQYEAGKLIVLSIISNSNPQLASQSAYQVSLSNAASLAQISSDNTSIQLLPNANPNTSTTPITITVTQPATANYPSGTATKTLTITPAPPPTITVTLNPTTVTYVSGTNIALSITSTSNPQPQLSAYTVSTNSPTLTRINTTTSVDDTIMGYTVELIANPSAPSQQVTITVIQPGTSNYPSGTGTATLTIVRGQTLVQTTLDIAGFASQDYTMQYLDSTGANPSPTTPHSNGYTVYKFHPTSTKSGTIKPNAPITNLSYLVIGGGGGGGNPSNTGGNPNDQASGGGGAGGFVTNYPSGTPIALQSSTSYNLTIGGGGAANTAGTASSLAYDNGTILSSGGGYGGNANQSGGNGGSGGGAGGATNNAPYSGGSGMQGQGNNGTPGGGTLVGWTSSTFAAYGGGGGGAGGGASNGITMAGSMVGGIGSWGGNGGSGSQSNIAGTVSTYAGGGGGGGPGGNYPYNSQLMNGMGGSGIGGNGGNAGGGSGTDGTGSGGGGGFTFGGQNFGGAGGSGIVIIRFSSYNVPPPAPTITVSLIPVSPVTYQASKIIALHITSTNTPSSLSAYTVALSSNAGSLAQVMQPSGSSGFTIVLGASTPTLPIPTITITVSQSASGFFGPGTGTTTLDIVLPQKNSIGWLPSGLMPKQPDVMTQEIVITTTRGTPFHVMGFNNSDGSYTLSRYDQGATSLTTLLTGTGSITSINEQLITNSDMSGGRNLIVCGNFPSATTSTTPSTTTRVNNIFQYNVETQTVIPLQCATTTAPTYPVGTNGQVWGCEVDTVNNRVWVWGDFYYAGTNSQGQTIVPLSDVALCSGSDFVTSANWTNPVSWQGISGYRGCRGGKVLDGTASYSLMVWASELSNLSTPPTFSAFNAVGMVYNNTNPGLGWSACIANCFLSGDSITQPVSNIQFIQNAGGSGYKIFLTGSFNDATVSGSGVAVCSSIVYANGGYQVDPMLGLYGDTLYQAFGSANTSFWVNNGVQISVSNLRKLTNDVLLMTTNGYVNGGILTVPISSLTTLPTKWGGFTAPYSANHIIGTDPTSVKLITNLNANPFYYSQTFNMNV
jgi:hypothetical protein